MSTPTGERPSWVPVPRDSDFPLENLPFGVFSDAADHHRRVGVAIGDHVLDLAAVGHAGLLDRAIAEAARASTLADLCGVPGGLSRVRTLIGELLTAGNEALADLPGRGLVTRSSATLHLPFRVGDYVDFYSSIEHATNVGRMFRPDDPPLLPNWRHLPIGYHGRSSTVAPSGTPIARPRGQWKPPDGPPRFGPSTRLDIELEVGFFTGVDTGLGSTIAIDDAEAAIAGVVLVNDWSARDLQAWEYRPLGPFLGKSFATTISPWVVTLDALAPYRVEAPHQEPAPLPHLLERQRRGIDLHLEVELNGTVISAVNFATMYWTMAQQLTHAASNGTAIRTGDLYASGTVSGPTPDSVGSLLERTWNGAEPITLDDGSTRTFLENGDTVVLRGWCGGGDRPRIGFGECRGTVTGHPEVG